MSEKYKLTKKEKNILRKIVYTNFKIAFKYLLKHNFKSAKGHYSIAMGLAKNLK